MSGRLVLPEVDEVEELEVVEEEMEQVDVVKGIGVTGQYL